MINEVSSKKILVSKSNNYFSLPKEKNITKNDLLNILFKLKFLYRETKNIVIGFIKKDECERIAINFVKMAQQAYAKIYLFNKAVPIFIHSFYAKSIAKFENNVGIYISESKDKWLFYIFENGIKLDEFGIDKLEEINVNKYLLNTHDEVENKIYNVVESGLYSEYINHYSLPLLQNKIWKNKVIICLYDTCYNFYLELFKKFKINANLKRWKAGLGYLTNLLHESDVTYLSPAYIKALYNRTHVFIVAKAGDEICYYYNGLRYRVFDILLHSKLKHLPWTTTLPFSRINKYSKTELNYNNYFSENEFSYKTANLNSNVADVSKLLFLKFNKPKLVNYYSFVLEKPEHIKKLLTGLNSKLWKFDGKYYLMKEPAFSITLNIEESRLVARLVIVKALTKSEIKMIYINALFTIFKIEEFDWIET